jgi:hypothetical protein
MFKKEAARLSEITSEASGASAIRIALHARRAVADLCC